MNSKSNSPNPTNKPKPQPRRLLFRFPYYTYLLLPLLLQNHVTCFAFCTSSHLIKKKKKKGESFLNTAISTNIRKLNSHLTEVARISHHLKCCCYEGTSPRKIIKKPFGHFKNKKNKKMNATLPKPSTSSNQTTPMKIPRMPGCAHATWPDIRRGGATGEMGRLASPRGKRRAAMPSGCFLTSQPRQANY